MKYYIFIALNCFAFFLGTQIDIIRNSEAFQEKLVYENVEIVDSDEDPRLTTIVFKNEDGHFIQKDVVAKNGYLLMKGQKINLYRRFMCRLQAEIVEEVKR